MHVARAQPPMINVDDVKRQGFFVASLTVAASIFRMSSGRRIAAVTHTETACLMQRKPRQSVTIVCLILLFILLLPIGPLAPCIKFWMGMLDMFPKVLNHFGGFVLRPLLLLMFLGHLGIVWEKNTRCSILGCALGRTLLLPLILYLHFLSEICLSWYGCAIWLS